jgi:hypothetical protein
MSVADGSTGRFGAIRRQRNGARRPDRIRGPPGLAQLSDSVGLTQLARGQSLIPRQASLAINCSAASLGMA